MGIVGSLWSIGLGVLGLVDASGVLVKKVPVPPGYPRPPASGGGVAWPVILICCGGLSGFWGFWGLLYGVLNISYLEHFPVFWVTFLLNSLCSLALGTTLVVSAIKTLTNKPILSGGALLYLRVLSMATIAVGVLVMVGSVFQL